MSSSRLSTIVLSSSILNLLLACSVVAQQNQYDKATPPQHAAGVSPLGSYSSVDLGTVNLSNGALNLKIPVGSVGGRGFSLPLTLNWSSKIWSGSSDIETDRGGLQKTVVYADFARLDDYVDLFSRIGPGWTVGAAPMIFSRIVRINRITSGPNVGCYTYTVPKLTLMLPDKGEIEFRDDQYDGMPLSSDCSGYVAASRGTRWHATDGSGTVFINDADNGVANYNTSGTVITAEGMRYHFTGERCDWIKDRNGNKITFGYTNGVAITDQLGRITRIQQNVTDPQNAGVTLALLITLPGYNGQSRYYKVKSGVMNQHYRSDINPTLPVITGDYDPLSYGYGWGTATRLFIHSYGLYAQEIDDWDVLSELILPDGRSMSFNYNAYGEVAEIQTPTGGKIWYDYGGIGSLPAGNSPVWETAGDLHTLISIDRGLLKRRTFPDGSTLDCTWDYSYAAASTQVTATSASGTLMLDQRHYFLASGRYYYYPPSSSGAPDGTQNTLWSTGIEYRTETRDALGVVIAASEQDWAQRTPVVWSSYPQEQPANDNRISEERKILDNGSIAKVQTVYQAGVKYNNPAEVKEFDYDQSLKRRTVTAFPDNANLINGINYTADSIHLLSLPLVQTVYDGNGTQIAQTTNEYDVYANDGNRALLQDYPLVSQHDGAYGALYFTRGNLTRQGQWLNTTSSFIYSYPRFDTLGNVVSIKDANGNETTISFADDFGAGSNPGIPTQNPSTPTYALPTLITSPPPQPGAPVHTARSEYDYSTGLLTGFRDRNNIVTQTIYDDPFNRPTQVKSALGVSGLETHTTNYYAPTTVPGLTLAKNDVLTVSDLNTLDDASIRGWTVTDGFGRTTEAWKRDPQGDVKVATIYDAVGRVKQVSNPFRPSAGEVAIYSTTDHGRQCSREY
jgi:YD repeat-containing protein